MKQSYHYYRMIKNLVIPFLLATILFFVSVVIFWLLIEVTGGLKSFFSLNSDGEIKARITFSILLFLLYFSYFSYITSPFNFAFLPLLFHLEKNLNRNLNTIVKGISLGLVLSFLSTLLSVSMMPLVEPLIVFPVILIVLFDSLALNFYRHWIVRPTKPIFRKPRTFFILLLFNFLFIGTIKILVMVSFFISVRIAGITLTEIPSVQQVNEMSFYWLGFITFDTLFFYYILFLISSRIDINTNDDKS